VSVGKRIALVVILLAAIGIATWWFTQPRNGGDPTRLILHGNVDIREVQLAFNSSERIIALHATEGQTVRTGDLLGELDTTGLMAELTLAEAQLAEQQQILDRLEAGTRSEEIRQARADLAAAEAELQNARLRVGRAEKLVADKLAPEERLDDERATTEVAKARLDAARAALDLALTGPRVEDIESARARRDALRAALALARKRLADATLVAPGDGVIRNRMLEPGDMASPQRPVFSIALTDPMWVRAYLDEPDLGRVQLGRAADITTDSFPGKRYAGWVGYISPTAEFTPKSVETREVRSHLVYQVRIYVCNPEGELRLGMPATVEIDLSQPPSPQPGCAED
jgi:HlyD family secretion protein